jgi:hypothetical protein
VVAEVISMPKFYGAAPPFRFDPARHEYFLGEQRIPSITQLMEMGGKVKGKQYFTEAHRQRGTEVHRLCAEFDMGALNIDQCQSELRGHVAGYADAIRQMTPSRFDGVQGWEEIEVADFHPLYRFGGRRDRVGVVWARKTVFELKSGVRSKEHGIQLALQALLAEARYHLPGAMWQRLAGYTTTAGKCNVYEFDNPLDFHEAMNLIARFCKC